MERAARFFAREQTQVANPNWGKNLTQVAKNLGRYREGVPAFLRAQTQVANPNWDKDLSQVERGLERVGEVWRGDARFFARCKPK